MALFTLPLIRILYCWVLSKEVSSTILKVFGMTRPGIEPRSPGPLVNTLPTKPIYLDIDKIKHTFIYTKKNCSGQRSPWTVNSYRTFTDTNLEINKDHTLIQTIFTIKAGTKDCANHYQFPGDNKIWNTCRAQVYEIIKKLDTKFRLICKSIHFKISTFLSLDQ